MSEQLKPFTAEDVALLRRCVVDTGGSANDYVIAHDDSPEHVHLQDIIARVESRLPGPTDD